MDALQSSKLSDGIDAPLWMFWKRRRYVVVMMTFLGCTVMYTMRVAMSIAIVAMTENRTISLENGTVEYEQAFDWSSSIRGHVLSSFFYGYMLTQVPAGILANRFGATNLVGIGMGITAVLTLLTPLCACAGFGWLIANRVLQGMAQGVCIPSIHTGWSKWAPPSERSRMVLFTFAGVFVGTIISMLLTGVVSNLWGWQSAFYIFGSIGCLWFVAWFLTVRPTPEKDPFITIKEKDFILQSLGITEGESDKYNHPWKGILTSKAVYAIIVAGFCQNWGFYNMMTQLPTFLKEALHFEVQATGSISALPYLAMGITLSIAGYLADWFQIKGIMTTTQVRRNFNCLSFLTQAIVMTIGAFILKPIPTIACITLAVSMGAFAWSGYAVNHLDLSPKSAGVMMGITNTVSTLAGIIAPVVTGSLTTHHRHDEWRQVFYITAVVNVIGLVVYWCWASGELQPWSLEVQERNRLGKSGGAQEKKGYENRLSIVD
ncbi:sialin [Culex quinquefasciatus]|uniref:Sialin n=1 Tax=Culex quinquefasciatus TaxID=7176 RepID=B0WK22_CULQU|nr:sialin [Culex quinquefasciatus]|eukprot:XP_001849056.1 sialin [Culex quinquefasciatus]